MANVLTTLTQKQNKFVECMADGYGFEVSCAASGYNSGDAHELLLTPRISRIIETRARSVLRNDLAPKSLKFLGELVENKEAPLKERRQAAQYILERAGYVPPRAQIQEAAEKSISSMSADELAALVEKLETERIARADRATPLQDVDMLG